MGQIFDSRKEAMGFPKDGQKIKFTKPSKWGWFQSIVDNEKLLTVGQEYTVRKTELNSSSAYVWLEEFPDDEKGQPCFSIWGFVWDGQVDIVKATVKLKEDEYKGADND